MCSVYCNNCIFVYCVLNVLCLVVSIFHPNMVLGLASPSYCVELTSRVVLRAPILVEGSIATGLIHFVFLHILMMCLCIL